MKNKKLKLKKLKRKKFDVAKFKAIQSLPLKLKIEITRERIREFYEHMEGQVYVAFSGGKDSTVLLYLVRELYPEVIAVFSDTGLEYPEIRAFVKTFENVVWLKPKMSFKKVIEIYGYPVVSKQVAKGIRILKNPLESNAATRNLLLTGYTRAGRYIAHRKLSKKWHYLIETQFKISEQCCDVLKKKSVRKFEREYKLYPFLGIMATDSNLRRWHYLQYGCNHFGSVRSISSPLSFWTEQDVLQFLYEKKIKYSSIYGKFLEDDLGLLKFSGEQRTGCVFCMFGVHLEKGENRFQRLYWTHPKLYDYCIHKLGCGKVLDYIGVDYRPIGKSGKALKVKCIRKI